MSDSARFQFPYLAAAQAQKHVTVNEALARIDAFAAGRIESFGAVAPPVSPLEGDLHVVGASASGDWAGQDGAFALYSNGGWQFAEPWAGARGWDVAGGVERIYTGSAWITGGGGSVGGASGAATVSEIVEVDHLLSAGATSIVAEAIPENAIVFGVTGRVTEAIGGAATWRLGVAGSDNRYGTGLGVGLNSFAHGVTGQPQGYFADTDLVLTAEGGSFTAGRVTLAVHLVRLTVPAAV